MCDEPIAALDVSIQAQVVNLLQDLQEELGLTYLFTAHDLSMVRYISTRIGVMYLGRIVEKAKSRELFKNPLHPYTKLLLSSIPLPDPENAVKKRKFKSVQEAALTDVMRGCNFAPRCEYKTELCLCEVPILRELEAGHFVACHNAKEIN
jgi:oligopeptide/dipeptide ABC transporter, ATP-binding protein, C-terminal domain